MDALERNRRLITLGKKKKKKDEKVTFGSTKSLLKHYKIR